MKKRLWKIWQRWLVCSIPINIISLIICACMFDSESNIPLIVGAINMVWLTIIVIANSDNKAKRSKEYMDGTNDKKHIA